MHPSDIADLLASVPEEPQRLQVLKALPTDVASETLAEMEEDEDRAELLTALSARRGAALLHELADDDAADLLGELEPGDRDRMLAALPSEEAGEIRELLRYGEETAGGLMTASLVSVSTVASAAEAHRGDPRTGARGGGLLHGLRGRPAGAAHGHRAAGRPDPGRPGRYGGIAGGAGDGHP